MSDIILKSKLESVVEHVDAVLAYFGTVKEFGDFHVFPEGQKTFDAIMMRLQAAGETIKQIETKYSGILETYPETEWVKIIRLRDVISHHYDMLETEIVFDICENFVPQLKNTLLKMLAQFK